MKVRFMIENPQAIEATMKITMTVQEWEQLRDQLQQKYPSWKLSEAISSVITDARRVVYAPEKDALA